MPLRVPTIQYFTHFATSNFVVTFGNAGPSNVPHAVERVEWARMGHRMLAAAFGVFATRFILICDFPTNAYRIFPLDAFGQA